MSSYPFAMFVKCGVQFPLCFSDAFCVTGLLHWRWSFDLTDGSVWLLQADFTSVKVLKKNHSRRTGQLRGRGHFLSYSDNSEGILRLQKKKHLSERIGFLGVDDEFETQSQNGILDDQRRRREWTVLILYRAPRGSRCFGCVWCWKMDEIVNSIVCSKTWWTN